MTKLWIDDLRPPPGDGWVWIKTSANAIATLTQTPCSEVEVASFDHDLGNDDTTRPIVLWMCEHDWWPARLTVHSANPVGVEWLTGMFTRYSPAITTVGRLIYG